MKVLIVDDDVVARMVLMDLVDRIAGSGIGRRLELLEAEDGDEAWRRLDGGERPGLLFCDLRMPRLSGMELLARVKADPRFAGVRFVLVSAASDAETMREALGLGADGYVVKPLDEVKLRERLAALEVADETPQQAALRLGIERERMLAYLGGLRRQLDDAVPQVGELLASGFSEAAGGLLARLAEGCRMLGIASAAYALDVLARQPEPDAGAAARALESALAVVLCRIGSLQGLPG